MYVENIGLEFDNAIKAGAKLIRFQTKDGAARWTILPLWMGTFIAFTEKLNNKQLTPGNNRPLLPE
ncbi:hypothetical protein [Niabella aquatica]